MTISHHADRLERVTRLVEEAGFIAKIPVTLIHEIDDQTGWGPYLSAEDAAKLDEVRQALRIGDLERAATFGKIFRLNEVAPFGRATRIYVRTGIGGWTFDAWNGTFYPPEVKKKDQLAYASRQLRTIEINGTYYRGQKPETFAKWANKTPDGFVFAVKGNRFVTNRKVLAEAGESMAKFFATGVTELGDRLGPILWQFAPTKKFEPDDFNAFLDMLPREYDGVALRHAVEVRHESFATPEFITLARRQGVAIVGALHATYPAIWDVTADFAYLRLQTGSDDIETCYGGNELAAWAKRFQTWSQGGTPHDLTLTAPDALADSRPRDVFAYLISSGKSRAPAGAMALQRLVDEAAGSTA